MIFTHEKVSHRDMYTGNVATFPCKTTILKLKSMLTATSIAQSKRNTPESQFHYTLGTFFLAKTSIIYKK